MESFISFFSFQNPSIQFVVLGAIMIAISSSVIGTFIFLKKQSLLGDAIAHAVLPGICLGFLFIGEKNIIILTIGAFLSGWVALLSMNAITTYSKLKKDTSIGLVLSVFFGIGILLLTYIQHSGNQQQAGLDHFLFGQMAAIVRSDFIIFSIVSGFIIFMVSLFYKELKLLCFDKTFAKTIGIPIKFLEFILTGLTVLTIIIGVQAMGVVLIAAMLITPIVAAKFLTEKLFFLLIISSSIAVVGSVFGAYFSYIFPSVPTGPIIIIVISLFTFFFILIAPQKGLLSKLWRNYKNKQQINDENILKTIYKLGEKRGDFFAYFNAEELLEVRFFSKKQLSKKLKKLYKLGYLSKKKDMFIFTKEGKQRGSKIVKLHRLWELYLSEYLNLPADHIHDDAESMEHIITPEIEVELEKKLQFPKTDPHDSTIPYH